MNKKPNTLYELLMNEWGFESVSQMVKTTFGVKSTLFIALQTSLAGFNVFMAFAKEWIWDPPRAIGVIMLLIIVETITGAIVAVKSGKQFDPKKFGSGFIVLMAHVFMMAMAHNIANIEPSLFWLTNAFFGWFAMRNFLSIMKDLIFLKLVRGEFFDFIKNKLNLKDEMSAKSIKKDLDDKSK
jgi:hypothetical protein